MAWVATGLEPFSGLATVAVVGAGVVAVLAGAARRPSPPPTATGTALPWVVLVVALAGWQLAAYLQHPRRDHPTISALVNAALDPRPVRIVALAAWLLAAAALGARWRRR